MKIAILGTRGIPNRYGGFEQITEWLSQGLVIRGHDVTVYNSHNHPHRETNWNGVRLVHCYDPEYLLQTAGQFIYDLNCIRDAARRSFDVILFMGYTSSSVWRKLYPPHVVIISNMDGFEWKRTKYSKPVRQFLKFAESLAVKHSHFHIADSRVVQDYIRKNYRVETCYIPYGSAPGDKTGSAELDYGLQAGEYFLLMARMEPENNIQLILEGFSNASTQKKFLVIGNANTRLGKKLVKKFGSERIIFAGGIFDKAKLESLRKNAAVYFHGHSVGGTNPSLLEAMSSGCVIAAHKNPFNEAVLGGDAFYFSSEREIKNIIEKPVITEHRNRMIANNLLKLEEEFNREKVIDQYESFITSCYKQLPSC